MGCGDAVDILLGGRNGLRMESISDHALLETAVRAACAAGEHALANKGRRFAQLASAAHDVKLVLDRECQEVATKVIRERFPRDPIWGEEGRLTGDGAQVWIVDPIDGTVNFFQGIPHWCCSIAVRDGLGRSRCGCVYLPESGACFTAVAGQGAFCGEEEIRVSDTRQLSRAVVLMGLGDAGGMLERLPDLYTGTFKLRILGAAAADLAYVACGRADAVLSPGLFPWDFAAGELLVREAGGTVWKGRPDAAGRVPLLAGRAEVVADLLRLLPEGL